MFIYSVTINIEKEAEQAWLDFMQEKHIADVLSTGYFTAASMRKDISDSDTSFSIYNIEYSIETEENYSSYLQKEAPRLQKDVLDRFEGKFTAKRSFYNILYTQ